MWADSLPIGHLLFFFCAAYSMLMTRRDVINLSSQLFVGRSVATPLCDVIRHAMTSCESQPAPEEQYDNVNEINMRCLKSDTEQIENK